MFGLLEKILQVDEQLREVEWGFINLSGKKVGLKEDHGEYAWRYLKKHNLRIPNDPDSAVAKFLGLTGFIRYFIDHEEAGFTIVTSVNAIQMNALERIGRKRDKDTVFDIIDKRGNVLLAGSGFSNLISALKNMDLLEKILHVDESSIDFPRQDLDDAIWDKEDDTYTLKKEVKEKILAILEEYPDVLLLEIAEEIRIVGSLCTNQFLDVADCDAHIIPKNIDEWSEEEVNKVIRWFNENRDELDGWIDGHPLEVYVQLDPNQDLMSDGCYNLLEDEWLVGPKVVPMSTDPYEDFSHIADDIRSTVENADKLFGELKRDVIDFEVIQAVIERMSGEDRDRLLQKLEDKLNELEDDIEALYKEKGEWTDARREASKPETPEQALKDVELAKNWKDVNATFKFVNRYKYMRIIKNLKDLLSDDEITPDEVDKIKSIMGV